MRLPLRQYARPSQDRNHFFPRLHRLFFSRADKVLPFRYSPLFLLLLGHPQTSVRFAKAKPLCAAGSGRRRPQANIIVPPIRPGQMKNSLGPATPISLTLYKKRSYRRGRSSRTNLSPRLIPLCLSWPTLGPASPVVPWTAAPHSSG